MQAVFLLQSLRDVGDQIKRVVVTTGTCCVVAVAWSQTPPPLTVVPPTEHSKTWVGDVLPLGATGPSAVKMHNCLDQYPTKAKGNHIEGTTSLTYQITEDGRVKKVKVAKSSGSSALDKAAVGCVKVWTYEPAKLDNKPIEISWRNDAKWVINTYAAAHSQQVAATTPPSPPSSSPPPVNVITVQRPGAPPVPPRLSSPFKIGRPHTCATDWSPDGLAERAQGTATVKFTITAEGTTSDTTIAESSGFASLDDASVACVSKWRYGPAKNDAGEPVAVPNTAKIQWSIN